MFIVLFYKKDFWIVLMVPNPGGVVLSLSDLASDAQSSLACATDMVEKH